MIAQDRRCGGHFISPELRGPMWSPPLDGEAAPPREIGQTRPSAAGSLPRPLPQELRPRLRAKPHVPVLPHARGRGAQVAARAQHHGRVQGRGRKLGHLGSLADHDSPGALEQAGQVLGAEALLLGVDRLTDGRLGRGDQGPGPGAAQSAAAVVVPVDLHPPKIAAQAPCVQASPARSPAPDRDLTRRESPGPEGDASLRG